MPTKVSADLQIVVDRNPRTSSAGRQWSARTFGPIMFVEHNHECEGGSSGHLWGWATRASCFCRLFAAKITVYSNTVS